MGDPFLDYCSSQELAGDADAFICAECGEGFVQYTKLVRHTRIIHGSSEAYPAEVYPAEASNGLEAPVVFALQKNGTLTVVEKLEISDSGVTKSNQFDPQSKSTSMEESAENRAKPCSCERCGETFANQLSLQQHQHYHSLGQEFKCTLCCKLHTDRDSLREHLQIHAHERFYSCGHCGKRFLKQETLSVHQKEKHGSQARNYNREAKSQEIGKFYQCKLCDMHFFWLSDLQSHLISHSMKKTENTELATKENVPQRPKYGDRTLYRCDTCGKGFRVLADLKQHRMSHLAEEEQEQEQDEEAEAEEEDTEEESEEEVTRPKTLPKRQKQKATAKAKAKAIPNIRGKRPFTPRQYNSRLDHPRRRMRGRTHGSHQGNTRLYPCKHCHRVFVHSSSLSRHNRYHKGTLHTCMFCGRHFPQRCDVTRHIALYHQSELGDATDENDEDEKSIDDRALLKQARQYAENIKKGSSDKGPSKGSDKSSVPKARLSFKCRECGKVFGLISVYKRHQRYHRIESNRHLHKCTQCRCRFSQLSALERHLKTHENPPSEDEKDELPTVDKSKGANGDSEDSDEGESAVKPELLYECTVCGNSYASMKTFLKHQMEH
ncbi:zinc finger protein 594 [Engraulis encrasicolus]|uniref:zinc finger protein 594 n=1 Tax=Engraulis encrasicolus TaxID=184585 RepID=UPI002FD68F1B